MILSAWFNRLLSRRHGGVLVLIVLFLAVSAIARVALLVKAHATVSYNASLVGAFVLGPVFDIGAALLFSIPLILLLMTLPQGFFTRSWGRGVAHLVLFGALALMLFGAVSEWVFWDEFGVRFNFIAVDYLVYTKEVIDNIKESYPMPLIFGGLLAATAAGYWAFCRTGIVRRWLDGGPEPLRRRLTGGGLWLALSVATGLLLDSNQIPAFANNYNRELAKNGVWSLVAAFRNNELDYDQFYPTLPVNEAFRVLRADLAADGSVPLTTDPLSTLRWVKNDGTEAHPNIIQITVESLSAEFLGCFNPASKLTPNLDELYKKSLVFDNFYATGTRTDRGMEALTLSIPPTPGRSLVKRPHNENLFTLGSVLRSRGYDTAFIYSGYGYFDNMNAFFGNNGYRTIDRGDVPKKDITFANAWGACDEDLLNWVTREADKGHAAGTPFHYFVMTTSNHRPFTFPEGKIDLPSKTSGRDGGVKYTDFAIGQFLRNAESKPWFRNTVFVVVADHCASSAGKTALPVQNYHIPMFIYAPGGQIASGHVTQLMSQVDYAPTLLGLLHWSYASRFFGVNVLSAGGERRALIGNYQKLGFLQGDALSILSPVRQTAEFNYDPSSFAFSPREPQLSAKNISYYQTASYLYKHDLYPALTPQEQAEYTKKNDQ